jgi:hypothetical protein
MPIFRNVNGTFTTLSSQALSTDAVEGSFVAEEGESSVDQPNLFFVTLSNPTNDDALDFKATESEEVGLEYKLDRCFVKSWSTSGDAAADAFDFKAIESADTSSISVYGQPVTFTATVSPIYGDGIDDLATYQIDPGADGLPTGPVVDLQLDPKFETFV